MHVVVESIGYWSGKVHVRLVVCVRPSEIHKEGVNQTPAVYTHDPANPTDDELDELYGYILNSEQCTELIEIAQRELRARGFNLLDWSAGGS